jgi:adenine deaminase
MPAFHVPPLAAITRDLAAVASGRGVPDLVITGARVLSVYTEKLLPGREFWLRQGRIAAVKAGGELPFRGRAAI